MTGYPYKKMSIDNIDRFYIRKSIFEAIERSKYLLTGKLLDVGCGIMPYKKNLLKPEGYSDEYISLDFEKPITEGYLEVKPDLVWDGRTIPLEDNSVDSILLTEVLEHCFEPIMVLKECNRVLKKGGHVLITVPFLWPLHDIPYDEFRYTPFSLEKILLESGFLDISIKSLGGWDASLGQMMGLWLNRSGIQGWRRNIFIVLFFPIIKWLFKRDVKPNDFYGNSYMITSLEANAEKQ